MKINDGQGRFCSALHALWNPSERHSVESQGGAKRFRMKDLDSRSRAMSLRTPVGVGVLYKTWPATLGTRTLSASNLIADPA